MIIPMTKKLSNYSENTAARRV